jgi:hypothetical protein
MPSSGSSSSPRSRSRTSRKVPRRHASARGLDSFRGTRARCHPAWALPPCLGLSASCPLYAPRALYMRLLPSICDALPPCVIFSLMPGLGPSCQVPVARTPPVLRLDLNIARHSAHCSGSLHSRSLTLQSGRNSKSMVNRNLAVLQRRRRAACTAFMSSLYAVNQPCTTHVAVLQRRRRAAWTAFIWSFIWSFRARPLSGPFSFLIQSRW